MKINNNLDSDMSNDDHTDTAWSPTQVTHHTPLTTVASVASGAPVPEHCQCVSAALQSIYWIKIMKQ